MQKMPAKASARGRGPGIPFQPGPDPRREGNGRKRLTPEARLAKLAQKELVQDLAAALRPWGRAAVERLVALTQSKDGQLALASVNSVLDRAYGRPVAAVQLSGSLGISDARVIGPEDIRAALLKLQAGFASDAVPVLKQEPEAGPEDVAAGLALVDGVVVPR